MALKNVVHVHSYISCDMSVCLALLDEIMQKFGTDTLLIAKGKVEEVRTIMQVLLLYYYY